MIDEIDLLRGKDYALPCGIVIHHPTVGEILDWDEERYDQFVYNFCAVPTDYRVPLYDAGIDCDEMSDYELFLMLYQTFTREQSHLLFSDLDFTCFQLAKRNDNGNICIANPENGVIIDEVDYLSAVEFIRAINGLKRPSMKAGNAATKAFLIEDERIAMRFRKKKKFESILFPLISSMVNSPGFKYNYQECMDLPIFTFYESVSRIQKIMNHNALITGIYSGCVDGKKKQMNNLTGWAANSGPFLLGGKPMKFEQFIADSMKRVSVFDLSNNDLLFMATQIQDGSLSGTVDQQEVTGMNGIVIARLDRSKGASVSWTNGLIVTNGIATQAGAEIEDASEDAPIVAPAIEIVGLKTDTTATLPSTPINENVKTYKVSKTGGQGDQLTLAATAEKGKFAIDGADITFADGEFSKGDKFFAIYDYNAISGTKISNKSDVFTKSVKVIAEIVVRDVCDDTIYVSKLVFPRARG